MFPGSRARQARRSDNLKAICVPVPYRESAVSRLPCRLQRASRRPRSVRVYVREPFARG
jgi:hypothetical protein